YRPVRIAVSLTISFFFFLMLLRPPTSTLFPYTTLFRSLWSATAGGGKLATHPDRDGALIVSLPPEATDVRLEFREPSRVRYAAGDRKSTRLNSSHRTISYAVFCLKKKIKKT